MLCASMEEASVWGNLVDAQVREAEEGQTDGSAASCHPQAFGLDSDETGRLGRAWSRAGTRSHSVSHRFILWTSWERTEAGRIVRSLYLDCRRWQACFPIRFLPW